MLEGLLTLGYYENDLSELIFGISNSKAPELQKLMAPFKSQNNLKIILMMDVLSGNGL